MTTVRASPDPVLLTGRLVLPGGIIEDGALVVEGDRISYSGERHELPRPWADLPSSRASRRTAS